MMKSTPVRFSSARMLRPSRPMIRPFMSSAESSTTETVVSAAWLAARRCMQTERMLRTRRSASRLVSSSIWRTSRAESWRTSSSSSFSRICLAWAIERPATRSSSRRCWFLAVCELLALALEVALAVGDRLVAARRARRPSRRSPPPWRAGAPRCGRSPRAVRAARRRCRRAWRAPPARRAGPATRAPPAVAVAGRDAQERCRDDDAGRQQRRCNHDCHVRVLSTSPAACRRSQVDSVERSTEPCEEHGGLGDRSERPRPFRLRLGVRSVCSCPAPAEGVGVVGRLQR